MGYAEAKEQGLPIGSGVVEATCKTLVTERLKRSGIPWSERGGQAILTLRALLQSNRFDSGWSLLLQTYRAEVSAPDNVVPLCRPRLHRKKISFGGTPWRTTIELAHGSPVNASDVSHHCIPRGRIISSTLSRRQSICTSAM